MNKLNDELRIQSRIDSICDGFALALRDSPHSESKLSIENLLTKHPDLPRTELLRQLLLEENDYRSSLGRPLTKASLLDRFPGDAVLIEQIFTDQTPPRTPDGTTTAPGDIKVLHPPEPPVTRSFSERVPEIRGFEFYTRKEAGTFGLVYHAFDRERRREVAIKVLKDSVAASPRERERFKLEIQALSRLRHPGIVQIHDSGTQPELCYYVMDYIESGNLAQKIADANEILTRKKNSQTATRPNAAGDTNEPGLPPAGSSPSGRSDTPSGRRPSAVTAYPDNDFLNSFGRNFGPAGNRSATAAVVEIGIQVADAMHYVHDNRIVHRDLKPNNLLVDSAGRVYVADFGLAQYEQVNLTLTNQDIGTLAYMAPEQLQGNRLLIDARSDIFSLGATLYELLALTRLRDGETGEARRRQALFETPVPLRRRNSAVSKDLETIIHRAVAFRPDDRYATMQELADDLRRFQRREPIHAKPAGPLKRFSLWVEREQKLAASLAASAALLLVILGLLLVVVNGSRSQAQHREALALQDAKAANEKLADAEAARYIALSQESRLSDPARSTQMAIKSLNTKYTAEGYTALALALRENHESLSWKIRDIPATEAAIVVHPNRQTVLVTASAAEITRKKNLPAIESDIRTGQVIAQYGQNGVVIFAAWSPDGTQLVTIEAGPAVTDNSAKLSVFLRRHGTDDSTLLTETSAELSYLASLRGKWPLAFNSRSDSLILGDPDHGALIFSIPTGELHGRPPSLESNSRVRSIAKDPDSDQIAVITDDGQIQLINTATWKSADRQYRLPQQTDADSEFDAAFLSSSRLIIGTDSGCCVISLEDGRMQHDSIWPERKFTFAADRKSFATWGYGDRVILRNGTSLAAEGELFPGVVEGLIFEPHNQRCLVHHPNNENSSTSTCSTNRSEELPHLPETALPPVFIANGNYLLLSTDGHLIVWTNTSIAADFALSAAVATTNSPPVQQSADANFISILEQPVDSSIAYSVADFKTANITLSGLLPSGYQSREWICTNSLRNSHACLMQGGSLSTTTTYLNTDAHSVYPWNNSEDLCIFANDQRVFTRSISTGVEKQLLSPGERAICLQFKADTDTIAVGLSNGRCRIINLKTATSKEFATQNFSPVTAVAVNSADDLVCFTDQNDVLYVVQSDGASSKDVRSVTLSSTAEFDSIKLSDDGKFAICWESNGNHPVAVVSLLEYTAVFIDVDGENPRCDFIDNSGTVAAGTLKGLFVATFNNPNSIRALSRNAIYGVERIPDALLTLEQLPIPSSTDNTSSLAEFAAATTRLVLWDSNSLSPSRSVEVDGQPQSLHVNLDRTIAIVGKTQWPARIWNLTGKRKTASVLLMPAPIVASRFCAGSTEFKVVSTDGTVVTWDVTAKHDTVNRLPVSTQISTCDISRDGSLVLAADDSGHTTAFLNGKILFTNMTPKAANSPPSNIRISPNHKKAVIFSGNGLTLWENLDGQPGIREFLPKTTVLQACWHDDATKLFLITRSESSASPVLTSLDTERLTTSTIAEPTQPYSLFSYNSRTAPGVVTMSGGIYLPRELQAQGNPLVSYQAIMERGAIRANLGATANEVVAVTDQGLIVFPITQQNENAGQRFRIHTNDHGSISRSPPADEYEIPQQNAEWLLHVTNHTVERWPRNLQTYVRSRKLERLQ